MELNKSESKNVMHNMLMGIFHILNVHENLLLYITWARITKSFIVMFKSFEIQSTKIKLIYLHTTSTKGFKLHMHVNSYAFLFRKTNEKCRHCDIFFLVKK